MNKLIDKFVERYNGLMVFFGTICLVTFIGCVTLQVGSRAFLPKSPSWTEEMARYAFIYMVAFGCSVAVRKKEFVGVDLLTSIMPNKVREIFKLIVHIVLGCFSTHLLFNSVLDFALIKYRMLSTAMQIPMQYVYFSMVILFSTLILSYFIEVIIDVLEFVKSDKEEVVLETNQ